MTEKTSDYMLKVTRFNSSDVIATSGESELLSSKKCTHTDHFKILTIGDDDCCWCQHLHKDGNKWEVVPGRERVGVQKSLFEDAKVGRVYGRTGLCTYERCK